MSIPTSNLKHLKSNSPLLTSNWSFKEDTDLYTIPLTFFDEPQGRVGGFALRMEPKVSDIIFKKYYTNKDIKKNHKIQTTTAHTECDFFACRGELKKCHSSKLRT